MASKLFGSQDTEPGTGGGLGWEEDYELEDGDGGDEGGTGDGDDEFSAADKAGMIAAIKAEREARKAAKAELDRIKADAEAAERKRAEEAGEILPLWEKDKTALAEARQRLEALEKRETTRIERVSARNEERIKAAPPEFADLVPEGLDPDATAAWLDKAIPKFTDTEARGGTRTRGGGKVKVNIPAEVVEEAKRHRKDPEYWFTNVWLRTATGRKWAKDTNYQAPST